MINAIGPGERISLSKLAITHLEHTSNPIRVAVDISIWLFQVQAGRGGRNPEVRTLFYRLLKFLALPIHPLFVYDGVNKPPFKRGKAVSGHRNAPIIQLSKRLIDLFRFPRHDAPGEAEAECANLQRAGIVDAVMSNDVDAMMFGSSMTIMNFSKESGSGTASASHVTCYKMGSKQAGLSNVGIDRAGMILFALLSGGDYLPSGVPKCGSKLAAQIAKAGFGVDLLDTIGSRGMERTEQLSEWRDRLQYELEENESGYFQTKHKAVRIPCDFPDHTVLEYYASPAESDGEELNCLRQRLLDAWDQDIDPLEIRAFAAKYFDWNYRSGARKVVRLLAEPLVNYRLRLQKPLSAFPLHGPSLSNSDVPMLRKVFKARVSYGTDGTTELQVEFIPIDVVGLNILEEEPNPPLPSQETVPSGDEEEGIEVPQESTTWAPPSPVKKRATKRYDPYVPEKMWIFETLARIGIPDVVDSWKKEEAEKAAPKKPRHRKTGPKKKGPIDPGMKRGSILKYGTLTKERTDTPPIKHTHLFEAAVSSTPEKSSVSGVRGLEGSPSYTMTGSPKHGLQNRQTPILERYQTQDLDKLLNTSTSLWSISSPNQGIKRPPLSNRTRFEARRAAVSSDDIDIVNLDVSDSESHLDVPHVSAARPRELIISYTNTSYQDPTAVEEQANIKQLVTPLPLSTTKSRPRTRKDTRLVAQESPGEVEQLHESMSSPSLLKGDGAVTGGHFETHDQSPQSAPPKRRSPKKKKAEAPVPDLSVHNLDDQSIPASSSFGEDDIPPIQNALDLTSEAEKMPKTAKQRTKKTKSPVTSEQSREVKGLATRKTKPAQPSPEPSKHLESIMVHDGFWTADDASLNDNDQPDDFCDEIGTGSGRHRPRNRGNSGKQNNDGANEKKKRIPRVSILDLT